MDYNEAARIIAEKNARYAGRKDFQKQANHKKLKNATYLAWKAVIRGSTWSSGTDCYTVSLFGHSILTLYQEYFVIADWGYFGRSTHDRLNEYMPRGFRVYGQTQELVRAYAHFSGVKRLLGYLATPVGVFPYHVPMAFTWRGEPIQAGDNVDRLTVYNVHDCLHALKQYAKDLVAWAFDPTQLREDMWLYTINNQPGSYTVPELVRNRVFNRNILVAAMEYAITNNLIAGFSSASLMGLLRLTLDVRSDSVLVKPTADEQAQFMEMALKDAIIVPRISSHYFRKLCARAVEAYFIDCLDFDIVTWHRRGDE